MLIASALAFAPLYLLALWYCRTHFYRDPTSAFFKPEAAYDPTYTTIRLQEAASYIEDLKSSPHRRQNDTIAPFVCIGVPTVARKDVRYFRECVGSLFEGLTSTERQEISFIPFFADSDPNKHPAYHEKWLENVADLVLTYDQLEIELEHIREMEADAMHREKGLLDYRLLLERCASTGAEYVAIIEDDVLSVRGWFPKMRHAVMEAENKTHLRGSTEFLYLRLFFTEEFLGWNSEYWPTYLLYSTIFILCTASLCVCARVLPTPCKRIMTDRLLIVICAVYAPLVIVLFFAAGRLSMLGLPTGVVEMNNFGCCSQSLVFPNAQIPTLLDWYREKKIGYVDTLTERLADDTGGLRWALIPSLMQHIGRKKSTKPADNVVKAKHQLTATEKIWNFGFELHDPPPLLGG